MKAKVLLLLLWTFGCIGNIHSSPKSDSPPKNLALNCPTEIQVLCLEDEALSLPDNHQLLIGVNHPDAIKGHAHLAISRIFELACAGPVEYSVSIYLENEVTPIALVSLTSVDNTEDQVELSLNSRNSPEEDIQKDGLPYNSNICLGGEPGTHRLVWEIVDACGGMMVCEEEVRIVDCSGPVYDCGVEHIEIPPSGKIKLFAQDYLTAPVDDASGEGEFLYSFVEDQYVPDAIYACDCEEIDPEYPGQPCYDNGYNCQTAFIHGVWVADAGTDANCDGEISWNERQVTYCDLALLFDDDELICGEIDPIIYDVRTYYGTPLSDVKIIRHRSGEAPLEIYSSSNGQYFHPLCSVEPGDTIRAFKEDLASGGVSTLDMIRIQKHLLGKDLIENPYTKIAADVNNSQSISAIDLIEIRKVILGINEKFPNVPTWKFIDAAYEFGDTMPPFGARDYYLFSYNLEGFLGIKMGDINKTVNVQNLPDIETRGNQETINLLSNNPNLTAGEEVLLPIYLNSSITLQAMQFTLQHENLELLGIESGALNIANEDYYFHKDLTTFSWFQLNPILSDEKNPLFYIRVRPLKTGRVSDLISISSEITPALAFDKWETEFDLDIHFEGSHHNEGVYATPYPNPFSVGTQLSITLPDENFVKISIVDAQGNIVSVIENKYPAGKNNIQLSSDVFSATGIYFLQITTGDSQIMHKLVKL